MSEARQFEILVQQSAGWTLQQSVAERAAALDAAAALLGRDGVSAVKVIESRFDPQTGVFEETDVQLFGQSGADAASGRRTGGGAGVLPEIDDGSIPACREPDDLSSLWSRRLIARTLHKTLDAWALTPTEILHHHPHYQKLSGSGTILQAAVQQAAIAMPKAGNVSAASRVKQIYEVIAAAAKRIEVESASLPGGADLAEIWAAAQGATAAERQRRAFAAVADRLKDAKGWDARLAVLSTLMPACLGAAERVLADRLVAETTMVRGGLAALITLHLGDAKQAAQLVAEGTRRPQVEVIREILNLIEDTAPRAPGVDHRLLELLRSGALTDAVSELCSRVVIEVESQRRLTGVSDTAEGLIAEAKAIAEIQRRTANLLGRMEQAGPGAAGKAAESPARMLDRVRLALENRSAQLLRPEILGLQLGRMDDLRPAVELLLDLARHLIGDLNRRRAARQLIARLGSHRSFVQAVEVPSPEAVVNLKQVVAWQDAVAAAPFGADERRQLLEALDRLGVKLMDRLQILKSVAQRKPDPVDQAVALFDLVNARMVTRGQGTALVRRRLLVCVQALGDADGFVAALTAREVPAARVSSLLRFLAGKELPFSQAA